MNGTIGIPTGKREYNPTTRKLSMVYDNIALTGDEIVDIEQHPRIKEATGVTLFTQTGETAEQLLACGKLIAGLLEFKGELTAVPTETGHRLSISRRPSFDPVATLARLQAKVTK